MSGTPFCTTGGMMLNSPPVVGAHRRALDGWDAGPAVPSDGSGDGSGGHNQPQHAPAEGAFAPEHDMSGHMDHMNHDHGHHMSGMGGGGTVMYMDGFRSALFPSPDYPPPPCLNLFSTSWTLADRPSFVLAMVVVTAIGVLVEACGVWRVRSLRRGREIRREARARIAEQRMPPPERLTTFQQPSQLMSRSDISDVSDRFEELAARGGPGRLRRLLCRLCPAASAREGTPVTRAARAARRHDTLAAGLHAARALLGYLLMLAVMSYAVEFLFCACTGMVLGRHYYADAEGGGINVGGGIGGMQPEGRHSRLDAGGMGMTGLTGREDRRQRDDAAWGGGGDPCCGLDDGDDDDGDDMLLEEPLLARQQNGLTRRGAVESPA